MTSSYALRLSDEERRRYRAQAERAQGSGAELWPAAGVTEGARVLDVGCGPGAVLVRLAAMVGDGGSVVGMDGDPEALRWAREELDAHGVTTAALVEGRAPEAAVEGPFDSVVLRHLLAHNGGREREILRWAAGLLRPGGGLYVMDTDMTMMRIVPETAPVSELYARYEEFQRTRGNDPRVGVKLADLLEGEGLEVTAFEPQSTIMHRRAGARGPAWAAREEMVADGLVTRDEVDRWAGEFARLDEAARQPRYVLCGFVAVARVAPPT